MYNFAATSECYFPGNSVRRVDSCAMLRPVDGCKVKDVSEESYLRYSGSSMGKWGQHSSSKCRQLFTSRHGWSPSAALAWAPRISQTY